MSSTFEGSKVRAALPTTSGSEPVFEQITGVPHAMASSGGSPKPSNSDGYANAVAPDRSAGRSSEGTAPRRRTALAQGEAAIARSSASV